MKKAGIAETVTALIRPTVEGLGYTLWDVEYEKIGAEMNLTVTIDNESGININDCEAVHRAIDPILDEADPIEDAYRLNVSSKGIEPELRTDAHIASQMGKVVELRLFAPKEGRRSYTGFLHAYENGTLTLADEAGVTMEFSRREISKISVVYMFDED